MLASGVRLSNATYSCGRIEVASILPQARGFLHGEFPASGTPGPGISPLHLLATSTFSRPGNLPRVVCTLEGAGSKELSMTEISYVTRWWSVAVSWRSGGCSGMTQLPAQGLSPSVLPMAPPLPHRRLQLVPPGSRREGAGRLCSRQQEVWCKSRYIKQPVNKKEKNQACKVQL